jgi:hypothetical protein
MKTKQLIEKYKEYVEFLSKNISDNAHYLRIHGIACSEEDYEKGVLFRKEISALESSLKEPDMTNEEKTKRFIGNVHQHWKDLGGDEKFRSKWSAFYNGWLDGRADMVINPIEYASQGENKAESTDEELLYYTQYIQDCFQQKGLMTYPEIKLAIQAWKESTLGKHYASQVEKENEGSVEDNIIIEQSNKRFHDPDNPEPENEGREELAFLNSKTTNPDENNGWSFDYKFLEGIARITDGFEDSASMEQIESVLLALQKVITHK